MSLPPLFILRVKIAVISPWANEPSYTHFKRAKKVRVTGNIAKFPRNKPTPKIAHGKNVKDFEPSYGIF